MQCKQHVVQWGPGFGKVKPTREILQDKEPENKRSVVKRQVTKGSQSMVEAEKSIPGRKGQ